MFIIQVILLELMLIFSIMGALFAHRRKLSKQVAITVSVPIAFISALLLTKSDLLDYSSNIVSAIGALSASVNDLFSKVNVLSSLTAYLIRILLDHFITVILFVIILIVFRIIISIVFSILEHRAEKKSKIAEEKQTTVAPPQDDAEKKSKNSRLYNTGVIALGALKGYMLFMFLILPVTFILNILTPAVNELSLYKDDEDINEVYVFADEVVGDIDRSAVMQISKYTGFRFFNDCASNFICNDELCGNNEKTYEIKGNTLLPSIARLGVNGIVAYHEYASTASITPKMLENSSNILTEISEMPVVHAAAAELLNANTLDTSEEGITNDMLQLLQDIYTVDNSERIGKDLSEIASLTSYLSTAISNPISSKDMLPEFMNLFADEAKCQEVIRHLSATHLFSEGSSFFIGYGIGALGDSLNLYNNKEDHYEQFKLALAELFNSTIVSVGKIDFDQVEAYIAYVISEGIDPNSYKMEDKDNMTELDVQFANYERYMNQMNSLRDHLYNSAVQNKANAFTVTFPCRNGELYYYSETNGKAAWTTDAPSDIIAGNLTLHLMLVATIEMTQADQASQITPETIVSLAQTYNANHLSSLYPSAPVGLTDAEAKFAEKLVDVNAFTSVTVYIDDILDSFHESYTIESFNEEGINNFAAIVSSAAELLEIINESEGLIADEVINNFGKIGVLLDAINRFEGTADIPESLLTAIRYSVDYGKYFNINAIDSFITNIENGESSYESLFNMIQSIYGLFQEIK